MKKTISLLLSTFFTLTLGFSQSQKDSVKRAEKPIVIVAELKQGSIIQGKLVERRGDTLVIDGDKLGLIKLPMSDIKSINEAGSIPLSRIVYETRPANKYANRTLLSPTALDNGKGAGEYTNYYLFLNQFSGGLTDNIRLGGTAIIVPGGGVALLGTAKLTVKATDNFHLAAGGMAGSTLSFNGNGDNAPISLVYGLATYGEKDKNLTIGVGGLRTNKEWQSKAILLLSGQFRVGDNWSLMGEFYTYKEQDFNFNFTSFGGGIGFIPGKRVSTMTFGARYFTHKLAFNFGIFALTPSLGGDNFIPIPVLGLSLPLDKNFKKLK